jgi:hypothetical protein
MWPLSCKQALRKIKQYSKPEPLPLIDDDEPTLPTLPRPPRNILEAKQSLDEWAKRIPIRFSSPLKRRFQATIWEIRKGLARAALTELELQLLKEKVTAQNKRKITSRKSLNLGGGTLAIDALRKKKEK